MLCMNYFSQERWGEDHSCPSNTERNRNSSQHKTFKTYKCIRYLIHVRNNLVVILLNFTTTKRNSDFEATSTQPHVTAQTKQG